MRITAHMQPMAPLVLVAFALLSPTAACTAGPAPQDAGTPPDVSPGPVEPPPPPSPPEPPAAPVPGPGEAAPDAPTAPLPAGGAAALAERLPASFTGVLPCAACPGIRYGLDLRPGGTFVTRTIYLGQAKVEGEEVGFYDIGLWTLSLAGDRLILRGTRGAPESFQVESADLVRKLDHEHQPIGSHFDYSLRRTPTYLEIEPRLKLRGTYDGSEEPAFFQECVTGLRLPVAPEGAGAELAAAYQKAGKNPGGGLLAAVEATVARRSDAEGRDRPALVVERLVEARPGENCAAMTGAAGGGGGNGAGGAGVGAAPAGVAGTTWRLVRLGADPVTVPEGGRAPYLLLSQEGKKVEGYAGCNRVMGSYELEGKKLRLGPLAATKMACPQMEGEQAFLKALEATASWELLGSSLELYDAGGRLLARFEPAPAP